MKYSILWVLGPHGQQECLHIQCQTRMRSIIHTYYMSTPLEFNKTPREQDEITNLKVALKRK